MHSNEQGRLSPEQAGVLRRVTASRGIAHGAGITEGAFDPYSISIATQHDRNLTEKDVVLGDPDSVDAWCTMIHEWVHFMQYHSTSYGLLMTLNGLKQARAFADLMKAMVSLGLDPEKDGLSIPLMSAIDHGVYPAKFEPALRAFLGEWTSAQSGMHRLFGRLETDRWGREVFHKVPREFLPAIAPQDRDAHLTTAFLMEPIAVACEGHWLMANHSREVARRETARRICLEPEYTLFPALCSALELNVPTRLCLHDICLMVPVSNDWDSVDLAAYNPVTRMLRSLRLLASGEVDQVEDSEKDSYLKLARALGSKLGWQDPEETVEESRQLVKALVGSTNEDSSQRSGVQPLLQPLVDLREAFAVRARRPDAFLCLTPESHRLYSSGWQPAWRMQDGWATTNSETDGAVARGRITYSIRQNVLRSFVLGGVWSCPHEGECGAGAGAFPCGPADNMACICRLAVELTLGEAISPEQIRTIA